MRRLLKYAFFLAMAAFGGYFVLAPEGEDVVPSSVQQPATTALLEPPPPAQRRLFLASANILAKRVSCARSAPCRATSL